MHVNLENAERVVEAARKKAIELDTQMCIAMVDSGITVPAASIFVMSVVLGGLGADTIFFLELLLLGFMLSEFLTLDLSVEKTVLLTCTAVIVAGVLGLILYSAKK